MTLVRTVTHVSRSKFYFCNRYKSTINYPKSVSIGSIAKYVNKPKNPFLVPLNYYDKKCSQTDLGHLQWMLKKDLMVQDVFLIGSPGFTRRRLALAFAELTSREIEYVSLSRDTTESDLKQRREVSARTAKYFDQTAVNAAINGRLLIIEGIEKAERNVLPLLNNLLENREMHLEDGRHLIGAQRYDELLQEHGQDKLDMWKLIRVHEDFRVIALGLPVPFFKGNPLDPPLRSRFQGRCVVPVTNDEMIAKVKSIAPNAPVSKLEALVNFAYSILWSNDPDFRDTDANAWAISLPQFPLENLYDAAKLLDHNPELSLYNVLLRVYPFDLVTSKEDSANVAEKGGAETQAAAIQQILKTHGFTVDKPSRFELPWKKKDVITTSSGSKYIPIVSREVVLTQMLESHGIARDICVIGERGSGKSVLISRFADILGYKIEPIVLYKDMTARDLLQQRTTNSEGDTIWMNAPLVEAALQGNLAVLDGIDQLHSSTLSIIDRLVHDRELQLPNGNRLLRADRFDELQSSYKKTLEEMNSEYGLFRIHPRFYIVATSLPPQSGSTDKAHKSWLTPEMLSLFNYHQLPEMSVKEELQVIESFCSFTPELRTDLEKMVKTARALRQSSVPSKKSLASSLSTRQLIRIAQRSVKFGHREGSINGAFEEISRACLSRFLPQLNKEELESTMLENGISPANLSSQQQSTKEILVNEDTLKIGNTEAELWKNTEYQSKVPRVLFFNIQQHIAVLEELLKDYLLDQHLLLVGTQGVGKNKLVDQLLSLLNRPREYIQLHRDTTVQALTVQQKVVDGVVSYEDSPLVKAAREGHVIVIDEADKAPNHVTSILKTLAERGEMVLSDNRRIVPKLLFEQYYKNMTEEEQSKIIPLHPSFRMFVLANKPGFPFLGNDFYSILGDLFSVHAVDNPSFESEVALLKEYGPSLPTDYIERIARAFGDLRRLADTGSISYPYSTREAVNIVKHLQRYPNDTISEAIDNIFDFDVYNNEMRKTVKNTLKKYKLEPSDGVLLRKRYTDEGELTVSVTQLPELKEQGKGGDALRFTDKTFKESDFGGPKHGKVDLTGAPHVGGNTWAGGSGGRDTGGLGGVGGPYRLDSGNPVFQVSEAVKQALSPEARRMAREMALKVFEEKLKEIHMSKYEGNVYEEFLAPIRPQIAALRVILSSLQAKTKDRKWLKHQTSGELDDTKIIEGIVGEKNIYRRREDQLPEPGDPQEKPKRLKLIVDLSGSMYRFNGYDSRLDRMLQTALMVMEAFQGFDDLFEYDIVGHSGDDYKLPIVEKGKQPKDNKQRLDIMRIMHLHSQFCSSGDNTLEGTEEGIKNLSKEIDEYDECFVIMLSDANLERYGIPPKDLTKILNSNSNIKAFAIFIGSIGDQAQRLKNQLPPGKAHICMDTKKLPQILQRIFTDILV